MNNFCLVFAGPPGTGKSSVAKYLADRWGWHYVDKNEIAPLPAEFKERGVTDTNYQKYYRPRSYQIAAKRASELLAENKNVIVEAPLIHEFKSGLRETEFFSLLPESAQKFIIWFTCHPTEQSRRRKERDHAYDIKPPEYQTWEEYNLAQARELFQTPAGVPVIDSTSASLQECGQRIKEIIKLS